MNRFDFLKMLICFALIPILAYAVEDAKTLSEIAKLINNPFTETVIESHSKSITITSKNIPKQNIDYIVRQYKYKSHVSIETTYGYPHGYSRIKMNFTGSTRFKSFLKELHPYIKKSQVRTKISRII